MMKALQSKSILLVDDEEIIREILKDLLEDLGAYVYCAAHAEEALRIAQAHRLDAVLTDYRMPGDDGITLLKKILSISSNRPCLFICTGYNDQDLFKNETLKLDYLFNKPFLLEDVRQVMISRLAQERSLNLT